MRTLLAFIISISITSSTASECARFLSAYRFLLLDSDFEISVRDLEVLSNNFFNLPDDGSVKRGQLIEAMSLLKNASLSFSDSQELKQGFTEVLREAINLKTDFKNQSTQKKEKLRWLNPREIDLGLHKVEAISIDGDLITASGKKVENGSLYYHLAVSKGKDKPYLATFDTRRFQPVAVQATDEILLKFEKELHVHSLKTGETHIIKIENKNNDPIYRVVVSQDGQYVVAQLGRTHLWSWDRKNNLNYSLALPFSFFRLKGRQSSDFVQSISVLPDQKATLIFGTKTVLLWNPEDKQSPLKTYSNKGPLFVHSSRVSRDELKLIGAFNANTYEILILNLNSLDELNNLDLIQKEKISVPLVGSLNCALSPNAELLSVISNSSLNSSLRIFDLKTLKLIEEEIFKVGPYNHHLRGVHFLNNSELIILLETGKVLHWPVKEM